MEIKSVLIRHLQEVTPQTHSKVIVLTALIAGTVLGAIVLTHVCLRSNHVPSIPTPPSPPSTSPLPNKVSVALMMNQWYALSAEGDEQFKQKLLGEEGESFITRAKEHSSDPQLQQICKWIQVARDQQSLPRPLNLILNVVKCDDKENFRTIAGDGNCLFHAFYVGCLLEGVDLNADDSNTDPYLCVREKAVDWLKTNIENASQWGAIIEPDTVLNDAYFENMRQASTGIDDGRWGGQLEILAMSRTFERPILVYNAGEGAAGGCTIYGKSFELIDQSGRSNVIALHFDQGHYSLLDCTLERRAELIKTAGDFDAYLS